MSLNIYLVSQDENGGYDTYDSFVCVAKSEEEARLFHPEGWIMTLDEKGGLPLHHNGWSLTSWAFSIDEVKVKHIGVADDSYKESQVLIASYHGS